MKLSRHCSAPLLRRHGAQAVGAALHDANDGLEARVSQRTGELEYVAHEQATLARIERIIGSLLALDEVQLRLES